MCIYSEELFDLSGSLLGHAMRGRHPWEILADLAVRIMVCGETLPEERYERRGDGVWIARSARVHPSAIIEGPCIIGEGSEVRPDGYIRGAVLIGAGCVVGHATEVKNAVFFDGATAPHFNYVGDSIIGCGAHLGAGAILSNLRHDGNTVVVKSDPPVDTCRRKLGGMIGDHSSVGCNAVLNPGTVLGRNTQVLPLASVGGVWAAGSRIGAGVRNG